MSRLVFSGQSAGNSRPQIYLKTVFHLIQNDLRINPNLNACSRGLGDFSELELTSRKELQKGQAPFKPLVLGVSQYDEAQYSYTWGVAYKGIMQSTFPGITSYAELRKHIEANHALHHILNSNNVLL